MPELNLNQITEKLNSEFTGEVRKLVFWYDDKADFVDDVDTILLENAKILKLSPDNQFATKLFLERQDTTTNYLVYAPFSKPDVRENHLEDTMLYSKRFFADRASLLSVDLGIDQTYKPIIEKHVKFFANKERTQRFYDLEIENYSEDNILIGLMSAICKTKVCSFDEVIRILLTDDSLENNRFIAEFEKYELVDDFWKYCEQQFGYNDSKPTLERLVVTMFVTYAHKFVQQELPDGWKQFVSYKTGNVISFLDSLMNNYIYRKRYDELSAHVATGLNAASTFESLAPEALLECDCFAEADAAILCWLLDRLQAEDVGAKLNGLSIREVCQKRRKMHFGDRYAVEYDLLNSAHYIISAASYACPNDFKTAVEQYQNDDYKIDTEYRRFYLCYDKLENTGSYESLRDLVENIYTNEYLSKQLPQWNAAIVQPDTISVLPLQRNFYNRYVRNNKERTVVIISDAMRYEVGRQLFEKLQDDPKCTAKLDCMLGTLPSYTRLGMAALLPHTKLELTSDGKELVDGAYCIDLTSRAGVLKSAVVESSCVQFDEIKNMNKTALREVFTGKQVVYVYHDQIDVRGEHSEDEVFIACEEAVTEIVELIRKIAANANTLHFVVTADHGFLYKRDKVTESEKIGGVSDKSSIVKRRYIVSENPVVDDGICNLGLGYLLGNDDERVVSFPFGTSVFKTPGSGGQNYIHGGSSPQELLVPVVEAKMEKGHVDSSPAHIMLVSLVHKITNMITSLDFIQSEAVSDVVKEATYHVYFISETGEKVSNECIYVADKRDTDTQKRMFRLRFTFKDKKYDTDKHYYLVAIDESSRIETLRHAVTMDLAFSNDFGFFRI